MSGFSRLRNALNSCGAAAPRARKIFLWLVGILVAIGIIGGLIAPPIVHSQAEKIASEKLHRQFTLQGVSINPYTLAVTVRGAVLKERGGGPDVARVDELSLDLSLASIRHLAPVIDAVRVKNPYLRVVRLEANRYNWSDLIDEFANKPDDGSKTEFSVNNIVVEGGAVEFDDRPKKLEHKVSELRLAIPFISNLPHLVEEPVQPVFSAKVNGTPLVLGGTAHPFATPAHATLDLDLVDLDLTPFVEYVPADLNFKIAAARFAANTQLVFSNPKGKAPELAVRGHIGLHGVKTTHADGSGLLAFEKLEVVLKSIEPLAGKYLIDAVTLTAPTVAVTRARDGQLDVLDLIPRPVTPAAAADSAKAVADPPPGDPAGPKQEDAGRPPPQAEVGTIRVAGGKLAWRDEIAGFATEVNDINAELTGFTLAEGKPVRAQVSLQPAAGETVKVEAEAVLKPLSASGKVELTGIRPAGYAGYYRGFVPLEVADGVLSARAAFTLATREGAPPQIALTDLAAKVENLRLKLAGDQGEFLKLPLLDVSGTSLDLEKRRLALGRTASNGLRLDVLRDKDGTLNLARVAGPVRPRDNAEGRAEPKAAASAGAPWQVDLGELVLTDYAVSFEDRTLAQPSKLRADAIEVSAQHLSTAPGAKGSIAAKARIGKRGSLEATGGLAITPLDADLRVDARSLEIVSLQPYFTDKLRVTLTGGTVSAKGQARYAAAGDSKPLRIGYDGGVSVNSFLAVDKANDADFLKWKVLEFRNIRFTGFPVKLSMREVALSDFFSRIIVTPRGRVNLQDIVVRAAPPDAPAEAPASAAEADAATTPAAEARAAGAPATDNAAAPAPATAVVPPPYSVKIDKVTLANGAVDFSDRFVRPNYSADLTGLNGAIEQLSSEPGTAARVDIKGQVANSAPLSIEGTVNPLTSKLFLDIGAKVTDFELSPTSTYAAKYAGYGIEKGKLSLDVRYKIENDQLIASNRVVLNQLTFGDQVESPTATKLPVLLAVALLKDRQGNIDIDLPISGTLSDPKFSLGGIIIKLIVNLLIKAATSPFALLGAAFGGGEELSIIEFVPGSVNLTDAALGRLKNVAKALNDRPALKLEISGRSLAAADAAPAKKLAIETKVRAQKVKALVKKGESVESPETLKVDPAEYPDLLKAAYKEEKFTKPRNFIGLAKDLPVPEMERLMADNTEVGEEELRELADRRARVVTDWLVGEGKVPAERVFLVAPKLAAPTDKGAASRADLSLK